MLLEQRRKLLRLHYEDKISAELFAEDEGRLTALMDLARAEASDYEAEESQADDLAVRFEQVAEVLRELDLDRVSNETTPAERCRLLIEELVDVVVMHADRLGSRRPRRSAAERHPGRGGAWWVAEW